MADPAPTAPAAAPKPAPAAAAPAAPLKEPRTATMKQLYAKVQAEQQRLGWSDAKLCEFATTTLLAHDPYKRFKATTIEFLSRLRPEPMNELLAALAKAR